MTKIHATLKTVAVLCFIIATCSFASAQATRTWVSGVGDDVNPCSRTAPCKTWAGAISKTFIGGEIDALDPGGFGTVTVTKSITLDGCCITSILASGVPGITIPREKSDYQAYYDQRHRHQRKCGPAHRHQRH